MSIVEPNVLQLLEHTDTRYTLVCEVAKRGRQLVAGTAKPMIDVKDAEFKPLRVAVQEINRGLITYEKAADEEE